MADDTLPPPLGWAIVDCNGIAQDFGRRLRDQPWGVIEQHPPSPARVASLDEDAPYRAPHRVVAVHDEDTVRSPLAERDERIARMELLLSACAESLAGYRREHGHEQACDAEAAARKELEARNG